MYFFPMRGSVEINRLPVDASVGERKFCDVQNTNRGRLIQLSWIGYAAGSGTRY